MLTGEDGQTSIEKILSAAEEQALKAMSADEVNLALSSESISAL